MKSRSTLAKAAHALGWSAIFAVAIMTIVAAAIIVGVLIASSSCCSDVRYVVWAYVALGASSLCLLISMVTGLIVRWRRAAEKPTTADDQRSEDALPSE